MVEYLLEYNNGIQDISYKLYLVENIEYEAPQSLIVKESVGNDGGLVVNTGRLVKSIVLNGKLIHKRIQSGTAVSINKDFNSIKEEIENIKEKGYVVTLRMPMATNDAGKYIIQNFKCNLANPNYLSFTMPLTEYRQANVKTSAVNLIAIGPRTKFLQSMRVYAAGQ